MSSTQRTADLNELSGLELGVQSPTASFVAADEPDSALTQSNLSRHNSMRSLRRAISSSVHSAAEWLDSKSNVTRSEFGDIDPSGGEDEDDEVRGKLHDVHEARSPTFVASPTPFDVSKSPTPPKPRQSVLRSRLRVILEDQTLFSMYKRLMYLALAVNVLLLCLLCTGNWTAAEGQAPLAAVVNVFLCVLFRNELFFRVVYWAAVRTFRPDWMPLQLKLAVTSFLQSVGGLHSGAGMSSVVWMIKAIYDMSGNAQLATDAMRSMAYLILALLSISCLGAIPVVRHLFHDVFEHSHRLGGWGSLICLWGFVLLSARHTQTLEDSSERRSMRDVLESTPAYWLSVFLTVLVVLPWLSVRRVRVEFTTPSNHAALIRFPGPVRAGYLSRISDKPLGDWHAFGIMSDNRFTHTLLAGAVGDFTKRILADKPEYLYTRSVKFAALPYLVHMYRRVLLVATGSGLCPFMSFLLQPTRPEVHVIWVGKNLRGNFGDEIMASVDAFPPERRTVFDTAVQPRPNMLELTIATARARHIEIVIVTSNPVGTRDIVNGCRKAGVAAFGPIWDS